MQNNIDDILRKKLEDAEIAPPADLWNKIEAQLPVQKSIWRKSKYLILLLLVFTSSVGSVLVYENFIRENLISSSNKIAKNKIQNNTNTKDKHTNVKLSSNNIQEEQQAVQKSDATTESKKNNSKNSNPNSNLQSNNTQSNAINKQVLNNNLSKQNRIQKLKTPQTILAQKINSKSESNLAKIDATETNTTKTNTTKTNSNQIIAKNKKNSIKSKQKAIIENNIENEIAADATELNKIAYKDIIEENNFNNAIASIDQIGISTDVAPSYTTAEILKSFYPEIEPLEEQAALSEYEKQKEKQLKNLKEFAGVDVTKGFHAGILMSIHNNWLTGKDKNKETPNNTIKHKLDFGKSFGVNLGYDYTSRWGIQTEIAYNEQGQKYTEQTEKGKISKELDLAYLRIPLMVKYKINFINNYNTKPVIVNFLLGPQVNFLLSKKTLVNDKKQSFDANYNRGEFGLYGGVDFDLFMTKNFYVTFGSRIGFATALKKDSPKSFQIGFTTQFNFKNPAKIKK